jgi:hypothetical protein
MPGVGADAPANFRYPVTAVTSFLSALKAKDPERLAEATALRSQYEAAEKHKKTFKAILEKNLPDTELNDLANALDGFTIVDTNTAKSSARLGVILQKPHGNDILRRTIQVRLEAKGWKVLDIEEPRTIEGFAKARRTPAKGSR